MNNETKTEVKMYQSSGWDIKEDTPEYVLLKRNESSALVHLIVFCLFGWWTLGIANLIYYFIANKTKKIIK